MNGMTTRKEGGKVTIVTLLVPILLLLGAGFFLAGFLPEELSLVAPQARATAAPRV